MRWAATKRRPPDTGSGAEAFDLNIEKVLEHWPVANAVREFIANALDEQVITSTADPEITKSSDGTWHIRDFGRGVHYEHLTQKEDTEKLDQPGVIGQFGIGLKDALAVCDRRKVGVRIRSRHGEIAIAQMPKAGFPDVVTLHGVVTAPGDPDLVGTDVELVGVADIDVAKAKDFFLRYSGSATLESTRYGDVLARPDGNGSGRIYVKGLLVAEEPNFLFSYNVTAMNAQLRRSLNRERTNVGRDAYRDRVKEILKECRSASVAGPLTSELAKFSSRRTRDELHWKDVAIHACRVLQSNEKVLFVSVSQLERDLSSVGHARDDGYRIIVIPDDIAGSLRGLSDFHGRPMLDINGYHQEWNDSFSYRFVDPTDLTPAERAVFDLTVPAAKLAGVDLANEKINVAISETMRLSDKGAQVVGVWEAADRRIVVRRDQLADPVPYCGTLLHEIAHAVSGASDLTLDFEQGLTTLLGTAAKAALCARSE